MDKYCALNICFRDLPRQSTYYNVILRRVRLHIVTVEEQQILHILICACSLTYQAMHMLRIILSPVACLAVPYFSTLSHNQNDFQKNILNIKCISFFLQLLSEIFLILIRI